MCICTYVHMYGQYRCLWIWSFTPTANVQNTATSKQLLAIIHVFVMIYMHTSTRTFTDKHAHSQVALDLEIRSTVGVHSTRTFTCTYMHKHAHSQVALDLEIRINGRRLKQGPFTTNIRPARLSAESCHVYGEGTRGAEPGEEKVYIYVCIYVCVYIYIHILYVHVYM